MSEARRSVAKIPKPAMTLAPGSCDGTDLRDLRDKAVETHADPSFGLVSHIAPSISRAHGPTSASGMGVGGLIFTSLAAI